VLQALDLAYHRCSELATGTRTGRQGSCALQVFDMLAFKNDIGFWKNKQNVEGLSIKVPTLFRHLRMTQKCSSVSYKVYVGYVGLRCNGAIGPPCLGALADMACHCVCRPSSSTASAR
jgi:Cleft lip and palate transmembrane protein 1 (CLPTM1)